MVENPLFWWVSQFLSRCESDSDETQDLRVKDFFKYHSAAQRRWQKQDLDSGRLLVVEW